MSVLHRRSPSTDQAAATPPVLVDSSATSPSGVRRTRMSAAWVGICAAAAVLVVLIVFMLQNTRSVEITFLWMHGTLPLALALLIAGVGVAILAMMVGAARITQLRRRLSYQHH
jgi:putative membrane protein